MLFSLPILFFLAAKEKNTATFSRPWSFSSRRSQTLSKLSFFFSSRRQIFKVFSSSHHQLNSTFRYCVVIMLLFFVLLGCLLALPRFLRFCGCLELEHRASAHSKLISSQAQLSFSVCRLLAEMRRQSKPQVRSRYSNARQ